MNNERPDPMDASPVKFVVYGRIWPRDDPRTARRAQIEDASYRMAEETFGECRLIGMFFESEPRMNRPRPALGQAIDLCRQANAVQVVASLKRLAGNSPFLRQLVWSRIPVAFAEIAYPLLRTNPANRRTIRYLNEFSEGRVLIVPGGQPDAGEEPEEKTPLELARETAAAAVRERRLELAPNVVETYCEHGTYAGTARALNERGAETLSGGGEWHPRLVKKVIQEATGTPG
jgi:hypothetical protein